MIEQKFKEAIDNYRKEKTVPNDFLRAVLENDLQRVIGTADPDAIGNLKDIIAYCHNQVPINIWGNKDKVRQWLGIAK